MTARALSDCTTIDQAGMWCLHNRDALRKLEGAPREKAVKRIEEAARRVKAEPLVLLNAAGLVPL